MFHGRRRRTVNRVHCLWRIEEMKSGTVVQEKAFQQLFVEAVTVAGELVKTVLVAAHAEVQRRIAQGEMLVNQ